MVLFCVVVNQHFIVRFCFFVFQILNRTGVTQQSRNILLADGCGFYFMGKPNSYGNLQEGALNDSAWKIR